MGWPVEVWYAESKKRNLLLLEHSEVHVDFCVFMCFNTQRSFFGGGVVLFVSFYSILKFLLKSSFFTVLC